MFYFLESDLRKLVSSIDELKRRMMEIGQQMGESCREGAETFHDNFAHEDGTRQLNMLSTRFRELMAIKEKALIVNPPKEGDLVAIGKKVVLRHLPTNETVEVIIGSYMTFEVDGRTISYRSPLARLVMGAKAGEERTGTIGGTKETYVVESVS